MSTAIRQLAIDIHDTLQPNASLSDIAERVWMLKNRNMPDGQIRRIIEEEYSSSEEDDTLQITVESLPPEFTRDDWR